MIINIDLGNSMTPEKAALFAKGAITVLTPVVVALVKEINKRIDKKWLAAMTPIIGVAFGAILQQLGVAGLDWQGAAEAGGLGVLVREVYDKFYGQKTEETKAILEQRLAPPASKG